MMDKLEVAQWGSLIKERLAGGLLCCLILVAVYLFEMYCTHLYVSVISSSIYLSGWLALFVGALIWTFRERQSKLVLSEVTDWQCIAAFLLIVSQQIFMILPKEIHNEIAPNMSTYMVPAVLVGGIAIAGLIRAFTLLYQHLDNERRQSALQVQRLQELLATPPLVKGDILLVRRLIENQSIHRLSGADYLVLIEGCRIIDPEFFVWLDKKKYSLSLRDIVWCVLIRMRKSKEEIKIILGIVADGTYRTMKSRVRERLSSGDADVEIFLRELK